MARAGRRGGRSRLLLGALALLLLLGGGAALALSGGGQSRSVTVNADDLPRPAAGPTRAPTSRQSRASYPISDPARFAEGSPERSMADFVAGWKERDFARMARASAPSWRAAHPDPAAAMAERFGAWRLLGGSITPPEVVAGDAGQVAATLWTEAPTGQVEERRLAAVTLPEASDGRRVWSVNPDALARRFEETTARPAPPPEALAAAVGGEIAAEIKGPNATGAIAAGAARAGSSAGGAAADELASAAMRAAQAAISAPPAESGPPFASGGLGLSQAAWQSARGRAEGAGAGGGNRGWYVVAAREGNIAQIERLWSEADAPSLEEARAHAGSLLPADARPGRSYTLPDGRVVDLFSSASLQARFRTPAAWGGADPGTVAAIISVRAGRARDLAVRIGPGP